LDKESLIIIITKIREHLKQIRSKTKRYDSANWGFPFIAAFLVLLFTAAVILATSANLVWVAEIIADGAYFALVIGVLFQLGNVNSKTVREAPTRITKLKVSLQHVLLEKNKKEGAGFHGSG
jgi:uncharacterized membrane protein